MQQLAEGLVERDFDVGVLDAPRRLLVALREAQEHIVGGGKLSGERRLRPGHEGIGKPAALHLRKEAVGREPSVLRFVQAVEHHAL
ncbi:hypothetical protein D3C83_120110 [compost metagenome]